MESKGFLQETAISHYAIRRCVMLYIKRRRWQVINNMIQTHRQNLSMPKSKAYGLLQEACGTNPSSYIVLTGFMLKQNCPQISGLNQSWAWYIFFKLG